MATIAKRRRVRGGISWDAQVRVRGYGTRCKTFRSRIEAETWAARTEAAAQGRTDSNAPLPLYLCAHRGARVRGAPPCKNRPICQSRVR